MGVKKHLTCTLSLSHVLSANMEWFWSFSRCFLFQKRKEIISFLTLIQMKTQQKHFLILMASLIQHLNLGLQCDGFFFCNLWWLILDFSLCSLVCRLSLSSTFFYNILIWWCQMMLLRKTGVTVQTVKLAGNVYILVVCLKIRNIWICAFNVERAVHDGKVWTKAVREEEGTMKWKWR